MLTESEPFVICPICEKNNPSGYLHCMYCGELLPPPGVMPCEKCTNPIPQSALYCPHCGIQVTGTRYARDYIKATDPKQMKTRNHPAFWQLIPIAFFIPIIGIILGMVYLCKDDDYDRKLGENVFQLGVVLQILITIIWYFYIYPELMLLF